MKRFAIGFVLGLLFAGLVVVILSFAALSFGEKKVTVADGSTLVLHLEGDIPEQPPVQLPIAFLQEHQPLTMLETWQLLRKAAADNRIKALVLEPRDLSVGWAKLEELRDDVAAFKKSGKPVFVYLRGAGAREYYVATAGDKIFMSPEDELDLKGLRAQLVYVKGSLDKLGVEMEFEHMGKYKDAPDMFTRTTPTPETLEVMNQILDQYYGNLVDTIAQGRLKQPDVIRAELDNGPFVGKETVDNGFVDELLFEDEVFGRLKAKLNGDTKRITGQDYSKAPLSGFEGSTKIAYIVGDGDITRGTTYETVGDDGITSTTLEKLLHQEENETTNKAEIKRIDSTGGDGIASGRSSSTPPSNSVPRSRHGHFHVGPGCVRRIFHRAMTGDQIIAYPNTLTGSIGVFFGKVNLKGLLDKLGVAQTVLTRGKFSDIDDPGRPLTDEERGKLRREIEVFYRDFVERVASARKRPYDQVEPLAQGRAWVGTAAKQNNLVDELGGLDRAVELVKQKANIPTSEKIALVTYPPHRTLWDLVFNRSDESATIESMLVRSAPNFPIRSLIRGGILSLMPYRLDVR